MLMNANGKTGVIVFFTDSQLRVMALKPGYTFESEG